ncbi:hypothetical protein JHK85_029799 [Glycine max]|nr:hypothetical protein JHK85_029799 [Glycine max]
MALLLMLVIAKCRWEEATIVRKEMRDIGIKKNVGYSWVAVKNRVHVFQAKDSFHEKNSEIQAMLAKLRGEMKKAGYVPDANLSLFDLEEEEKASEVWYHSEKIALAFGLITLPRGVPIQGVVWRLSAGNGYFAYPNRLSPQPMQNSKILSYLFIYTFFRKKSREKGSCVLPPKPFMEFVALSNATQLGSFNPLRTNLQKVALAKPSSALTHPPTSTHNIFGPHSADFELSALTALSPLDGRYWGKVKELSPFLREYGLICFRLSQIPEIVEVPSFSEGATIFLQGLIDDFSVDDALEVKNIERVTNHDVKAVLEFFHFACTSEDINNLAHALMLKETMNSVMDKIIKALCDISEDNAHVPMLSRTHGQKGRNCLRLRILGKFSGAVGNYNAHVVSYPEVNWPHIAEQFVQSLGLSFNPYVAQTTKAGEVGSSTMPHKVNPIDFENSEGNLGVANGEGLDRFNCLKEHGCRHRAFSSCLQKHTSRNREASGIRRSMVNEARLSEDLNQCWEVLAEPIQTVMRRYGVSEPYEKLKELTRGRAVTQKSIRDFIEGLYIPEEAKMNLLKLTPDTYVGAAVELARTIKPQCTQDNS